MNKEQILLLIKNGYDVDISNNLIIDINQVVPYSKPYFDRRSQHFRLQISPLYIRMEDLEEFQQFISKQIDLIFKLNSLSY